MKRYMPLIIAGSVVLIAVLYFISAQNSFVTLEENVTAKWSQVENVYQRRADLIPNLVETVKGYASHESTVLTEVTELRSRVGQMNVSSDIVDDPESMQRFMEAQNKLSGALSRLLVVSENYPELKANENFITLQHQIENSENRISVERMRYIKAVQEYNTGLRRFPGSLIASIGGFSRKATFEGSEGSDQAPDVEF